MDNGSKLYLLPPKNITQELKIFIHFDGNTHINNVTISTDPLNSNNKDNKKDSTAFNTVNKYNNTTTSLTSNATTSSSANNNTTAAGVSSSSHSFITDLLRKVN